MNRMLSGRIGNYVCKNCRATLSASQRRHASSNPEIYDVVTVGGGPAGLALLAALSTCYM